MQTGAYEAKILSGSLEGVTGGAKGFYEIDYFDIEVKDSQSSAIPVGSDKSAFVIVVAGTGEVAGEKVVRGDLPILTSGDSIELTGGENLRVIVVAGAPIAEPVARYGPFVMNTAEEIGRRLKTTRRVSFRRRREGCCTHNSYRRFSSSFRLFAYLLMDFQRAFSIALAFIVCLSDK